MCTSCTGPVTGYSVREEMLSYVLADATAVVQAIDLRSVPRQRHFIWGWALLSGYARLDRESRERLRAHTSSELPT